MLVQQCSATRQPHGERGNRLSQHLWQPPSPQTQRTPSSPPRHCFAPNSCNHKPLSRNRWTSRLSSSSHLDQPSAPTPPRRGLSPPPKSVSTNNSLKATPHPQSSQSAHHTGAHLLQPNSEACEAEDRCFSRVHGQETRVTAPCSLGSLRRCFWHAPTLVQRDESVDAHQHRCCGGRYGGGVDRRHAAVATHVLPM